MLLIDQRLRKVFVWIFLAWTAELWSVFFPIPIFFITFLYFLFVFLLIKYFYIKKIKKMMMMMMMIIIIIVIIIVVVVIRRQSQLKNCSRSYYQTARNLISTTPTTSCIYFKSKNYKPINPDRRAVSAISCPMEIILLRHLERLRCVRD